MFDNTDFDTRQQNYEAKKEEKLKKMKDELENQFMSKKS